MNLIKGQTSKLLAFDIQWIIQCRAGREVLKKQTKMKKGRGWGGEGGGEGG